MRTAKTGARFKPGDRIKIVWLYFKDYNAHDEEKWDARYRDRTGVVSGNTIKYDEQNKWYEYDVVMDWKSDLMESFYEFELEFAHDYQN